MRNKIRILAMALLMVFLLGGVAQAVEDIKMEVVFVLESGTLEVLGTSGYTDAADMNFAARTENGVLEVKNSAALRNEGTSWFVILEYGSDNSNEKLKDTTDDILNGIADMILDIDDGALIMCDGNFTTPNVQMADKFRSALKSSHSATDYKYLPDTLDDLMRYIAANKNSLMPNVAVVVITQARLLNDDQMKQMEATFAVEAHKNITTHVICPIAKSAADDRNSTWLANANRVADMGRSTLFGTGTVLKDTTKSEANRAVDAVRDQERSLIVMYIEPENRNTALIGKKLTVTQTTAGGRQMSDTEDVSKIYDAWKERLEAQEPVPTKSASIIPVTSAYTIYTPATSESESSKSGLSTELIIGIALAVVIIALVVILLIVNKNKGKKKSSAGPVYAAASSGSSSSGSSGGGAQVTLRGDDGSVYTGTLRNNRLVIGRDSRKGATLAIPSDGKLSGVHVILEKQGNSMLVIDQNSMNGTKVNGNKITGSTVLNQNGTLGIGSHTYTVTWRG